MTDSIAIIDTKIIELREKIRNENKELEKTMSFKYKDQCRKIVLIATIIMLIASLYVLITVDGVREFLILQAAIYIAYAGISAIPNYMYGNVIKSRRRTDYMAKKISGLEWLKTRARDQQEYFLNILKNRGSI